MFMLEYTRVGKAYVLPLMKPEQSRDPVATALSDIPTKRPKSHTNDLKAGYILHFHTLSLE